MTYLRYSQRRPSDDAALRSTGTAEASVARLRKVAAAAASGATIVIVRVKEERGVAGRLTLLLLSLPPSTFVGRMLPLSGSPSRQACTGDDRRRRRR
jgi:hypothetical protein